MRHVNRRQFLGMVLAAPFAALGVLFGIKRSAPDLVVTKVQVVARPRKLSAKWTIEKQADLRVYHGLDVEAELTNAVSAAIRREAA